MMTETNLAVDFKLGGKAAIALTQKGDVDSVMVISTTLPYGGWVSISLGGGTPMRVLIAKSSDYGPKLIYQINGDAQSGRPLEAPLVQNAESAVNVLAGGQPVLSVRFTNTLVDGKNNPVDVTLDVLAAGKKPTAQQPAPPPPAPLPPAPLPPAPPPPATTPPEETTPDHPRAPEG